MSRTNYGFFIAKENFRGRKERLALKFQQGYTKQIGFEYTNPYINAKKTRGINLSAFYSRNSEIHYNTTGNKFNFLEAENNKIRASYNAKMIYEIRPKLYNRHQIGVVYEHVKIADTIAVLNPNYLSSGNTNSSFFSISYAIRRDKRNFRSYPTKGYFYDVQLKKEGLSFFDKGINGLSTKVDFRKYLQLSDRFFLSGGISGKYSFSKVPYYLLTGFGFTSNLVRSYELYIIRGDHYGLLKTQLRYNLLKNKLFKINAIRFKEFNKIPLSIYAGVYFDAGYVDSRSTKNINFLTNKSLAGTGVAIDFVSYYDIVFRVEYSINKLQEQGLFLHFVAPI